MSYISHEDYKDLMSKFQAKTPKGILKEGWTGRSYDDEGEEHSIEVEDELHNRFIAGEIDKDTLEDALFYVSNHDYDLYADNLGADYVLQQVAQGMKEGNAFTAALAKAKKGEKVKVDGEEITDTSNYDDPSVKENHNRAEEIAQKLKDEYQMDDEQVYVYLVDDMGLEGSVAQAVVDHVFGMQERKPHRSATGRGIRESHKGMDQWYDAFEDAIENMRMTAATHKFVMKALDHVDPIEDYGDMRADLAAKAFVSDLIGEFRQKAKDAALEKEGLHMPPLQATGQTTDTVEENSIIDAPFGVAKPDTKKQLEGPGLQLSNLTTDERKQLEEYVDAIKTTKEAIQELLKKASGKDIKVKEDMGGNRTDLVMPVSEAMDSEKYEEVESHLDMKLHDAFESVVDKIVKDLKAEGVEDDLIGMFLKHEIEKKAHEAIMSQHDL